MVFDEFSSMLLTTLGFFAPFGLTIGVVFFRLLVDFSSSSSSGRTLVGLTVVKTKFFVFFLAPVPDRWLSTPLVISAKRSSVAASRPRNDPRWLLVCNLKNRYDILSNSRLFFKKIITKSNWDIESRIFQSSMTNGQWFSIGLLIGLHVPVTVLALAPDKTILWYMKAVTWLHRKLDYTRNPNESTFNEKKWIARMFYVNHFQNTHAAI